MKQFKFALILVFLLSLTVFSVNTFAQDACGLSSDRVPLAGSTDGMTATIDSPEDCSQVPASPEPVPVSGTAVLPDGYTLWLLVYVEGLYYPQPRATEDGDGTCTVMDMENGDGTWNTTAYFGNSDNPQELTFDLVLIAADAAMNTFLVDYYEPDCGNGPGISPDALANAPELGSILVNTLFNQAPVAEDFTLEMNEDESQDFNFLDYASDPDLDPLTVLADTQPAVGTLTVNDDGTASFAPDAEWSGTSSFTYHVNDGELDSNIATVTIIVYPVNDPPNCDALAANVNVIWSPNHKMLPVSIDENSINDIDSTIFDIALTNITHDEAINGLGDGNTDPDWDLEAGTIRAERSGLGDGRTYTISVKVDDLDWIDTFEDLENLFASTPEPIDGGACEGSVTVFVPHDMGNGADNKDNNPPANSAAAENAHGANPNANPHAAEAANNGNGSSNANANSNNANANSNNTNAAAATAKDNGKAKGKDK